MTYSLLGNSQKEIDDYTAIIDDPTSPSERSSNARYIRGVRYGQLGESQKAIDDYTAVIDDPTSPRNLVEDAAIWRAFARVQSGDPDEQGRTEACPYASEALRLINDLADSSRFEGLKAFLENYLGEHCQGGSSA